MIKQYYWQGAHVPYITSWSNEKVRWDPLVRWRGPLGEGMRYADENPDVDRHMDALWVRLPLARGIGEPDFNTVNALRQRQAMLNMLCQVCGMETFDRADERHLFIVRGSPDNPIREGEKTTSPPVHAACAQEAVQQCPRLRTGYTAALVKYPLGWGIAGIAYNPKTLKPLPSPKKGPKLVHVPYADEQRLRWTLAAREVVELQGVTPVQLEDVLTTAA